MKKELHRLVVDHSKQHLYKQNTAQCLSDIMHIARNELATSLQALVSEKVLLKIEERPAYYIDKEIFEKEYHVTVQMYVFKSFATLMAQTTNEKRDFDKLIGHDGSLANLIRQCKATIAYPPKGLPMLLYGPTGTGKSLVAKLAYEYACNQGLIQEGEFIALNCSEYANNPELLTANLFGYVKGAFTGADKDKSGLIELADGGVLFLDEVHNLKAECQEKLFQFMDQSIYHRVGDNEKWHTSQVRLILATTEEPTEVLLKTLQRRIPMIITMPSLSERGTQEKVQLIYTMFKEEEERLQKVIKLSTKVYNLLLSYEFQGNIGGLKSCVQSCCINSLFQEDKAGEMLISLKSLPDEILQYAAKKQSITSTKGEYIAISDLEHFIHTEKYIIRLNEELLSSFHEFKQAKVKLDQCLKQCKDAVCKYFDRCSIEKKQQKDFYQNGIQNILELVSNQYKFDVTNNDMLLICSYLNDYMQDFHSFCNWSMKNAEQIAEFYDFIKQQYAREYTIATDISGYLTSYLDFNIYPMAMMIMMFYIKGLKKESIQRKRAGVILAHGFSTASSIADAVNNVLGSYVFDAVDMPVNVEMEFILLQLNAYIKKLGRMEELFLLVDMGSLEEIYKGLHLDHVNVGIMNNISTKTALEIGNGILQERAMEDIFKDILTYDGTNYHIERNRQKEKIILCSCASGMGTANKIKGIIEDSLPLKTNITVRVYDYNELVEKGIHSTLFDDYYVVCVIGTLNPNIEQLDFVPIEDLIINDSLNELDSYLEDAMDEEQLPIFKKNLLKNFSLSNIMNNLTILNPNKLLEHVADAIDRLQMALSVTFSNNTCFGLYVHISCLIERAVMQKGIELYPEMDAFEKNHATFITFVKETFHDVEEFYGVTLPIAEIGYIYDYVQHDVSFMIQEDNI